MMLTETGQSWTKTHREQRGRYRIALMEITEGSSNESNDKFK